MNKILRNMSVIVIFVGFLLLSSYYTKSMYLQDDIDYNNVIRTLIDEEKKRRLKKLDRKKEGRPSNIFKKMFQNPSPWMGYTDELSKDFLESNSAPVDSSEPKSNSIEEFKLISNEMSNINDSRFDLSKPYSSNHFYESFASIGNSNSGSIGASKDLQKIKKSIDENKNIYEKFKKLNNKMRDEFGVLNNYVKEMESKKNNMISKEDLNDWKKSIKLRESMAPKILERFELEKKLESKIKNDISLIKHMI